MLVNGDAYIHFHICFNFHISTPLVALFLFAVIFLSAALSCNGLICGKLTYRCTDSGITLIFHTEELIYLMIANGILNDIYCLMLQDVREKLEDSLPGTGRGRNPNDELLVKLLFLLPLCMLLFCYYRSLLQVG